MQDVCLTVVCIAGLMWTLPQPQAQAAMPPCMECHRPQVTTIDPLQFARSVHGDLDCTSCHAEGFQSFPHSGSTATMPDCSDCHSGQVSPSIDFDKITSAVQSSIHVKLVDPAFRCTKCHSPHSFVPASRMTDPAQAILIANQSCLACHAAGSSATAQQTAFRRLVEKHRLFPHWELHIARNACVVCHTPRGAPTLHLILAKSEALRDCSACHGKNSLLVTKLYTHLALKERAEHGWGNAILFNTAYLTGATRNAWFDWGTLGLAGLTLFGVAAHGLGRLAFAHLRRNW